MDTKTKPITGNLQLIPIVSMFTWSVILMRDNYKGWAFDRKKYEGAIKEIDKGW